MLPKKLRMPPQQGLRIPVPELEVEYSLEGMNVIESVEAVLPARPPLPGARTSKFRFLQAEYGDRKLVLRTEGLAGSNAIVSLVRHGHFVPKVQAEPNAAPDSQSQFASISFRNCDADPYACTSLPLILEFPPGEGWKTITVTLTW
jgi:hypothetical protein